MCSLRMLETGGRDLMPLRLGGLKLSAHTSTSSQNKLGDQANFYIFQYQDLEFALCKITSPTNYTLIIVLHKNYKNPSPAQAGLPKPPDHTPTPPASPTKLFCLCRKETRKERGQVYNFVKRKLKHL
jgi:hypothetical protein